MRKIELRAVRKLDDRAARLSRARGASRPVRSIPCTPICLRPRAPAPSPLLRQGVLGEGPALSIGCGRFGPGWSHPGPPHRASERRAIVVRLSPTRGTLDPVDFAENCRYLARGPSKRSLP